MVMTLPSSKVLASAYTSRGHQMRFTSGTGSEVQMGQAEGKSMLYLEIVAYTLQKASAYRYPKWFQQLYRHSDGRTFWYPRCINRNLVVAMLDLECASSNDQTFSHSDLRRTARTLMQFALVLTLFVPVIVLHQTMTTCSFGSNWDAEDYDDWTVIQRDLKVNGGLIPPREEEVVAVRNKAARALQAFVQSIRLASITDQEVEAATYANGSKICLLAIRLQILKRLKTC